MNPMATFQEFEALLLKDPGIQQSARSNVQQAARRAWDALRIQHGMKPIFNKLLGKSLLDTLPDLPSEIEESPESVPQVFSEDNW